MESRLPIMLTIEQASREANLSSSTVRRICLQKKVCTLKSGKKWLINKNSLIEYLNTGGELE